MQHGSAHQRRPTYIGTKGKASTRTGGKAGGACEPGPASAGTGTCGPSAIEFLVACVRHGVSLRCGPSRNLPCGRRIPDRSSSSARQTRACPARDRFRHRRRLRRRSSRRSGTSRFEIRSRAFAFRVTTIVWIVATALSEPRSAKSQTNHIFSRACPYGSPGTGHVH